MGPFCIRGMGISLMIIFWVGAAKHYIRPAHETIGKLPKVRYFSGEAAMSIVAGISKPMYFGER